MQVFIYAVEGDGLEQYTGDLNGFLELAERDWGWRTTIDEKTGNAMWMKERITAPVRWQKMRMEKSLLPFAQVPAFSSASWFPWFCSGK